MPGYTLHVDMPARGSLYDLHPDRREYRTFRGAEQAARNYHRRFPGRVVDILEAGTRSFGGLWSLPVKVADVSTDALGRRWTTLTGQGSLSL